MLERPPFLDGLVAAAAVASFANNSAGFQRHTLDEIQNKAWGNQDHALRTDLFLASYLLKQSNDESNRYYFVHDSIVDFGLALAGRFRPPPQWSVRQVGALDNYLGDWIGLQKDRSGAVGKAIELVTEYQRPDLLVDVIAANYAVLSNDDLAKLCRAIGEWLVLRSRRSRRDELADRLSTLPHILWREVIRAGIFRHLARDDERAAEILVNYALSRTFSADKLQSVLLESRRRKRAGEPAVESQADDLRISALDVSKISEITDASTRRRAIREAAKLGSGTIPTALQLLDSDEDIGVREAAVTALGNIGDRATVPRLLAALETDSGFSVRRAAAKALGNIGDRAAVPGIVGALEKDIASSVRRAAAIALGSIGDRTAMLGLVAALEKDPEPVVRGVAATALGLVADDDAIARLVAALQNDEAENVRSSAAKALGIIGDHAAFLVLLDRLEKDQAKHVRGAAATALGQLGESNAVPGLAAALQNDTAENVRGSAATALGNIGDRAAVLGLLRALENDPTGDVRGSAATALGRVGSTDAVAGLVATLKADLNYIVRGSAATALGKIGDRAAVSGLVETLEKDSDRTVRGAAATALGSIGDREAVPRLVAALETDSEKSVRGAAASALGKIGDRAAVPPLCEALLHNPEENVRGSAASALGKICDRSALPALEEALHREGNDRVRASAILAIRLIGDEASKKSLLDLAFNPEEDSLNRVFAFEAALRIDDTVIEKIFDVIVDPTTKHWSQRARGKLIDLLNGRRAPQKVVDYLEKTSIFNRNPIIRTNCVRVLRENGQLSDETIGRLIDPDQRQAFGNKADTEWGVQTEALRGIVERFMDGKSPSNRLQELLGNVLKDPDSSRNVVAAVFSFLEQLADGELERAVAAIELRLPRTSAIEFVRQRLDAMQTRLRNGRDHAATISSIRKNPESLLADIAHSDKSLEEGSQMPNLRPAVIVTANERESQEVYALLQAETGKTTLEQMRVKNNTIASVGSTLHESGSVRPVLLVALPDTGPQESAAAVADILEGIKPRILLLVGCCGAITERIKDAGSSSVIVARQVVDVDRRTERQGKTLPSMITYRSSQELRNCIAALNAAKFFGDLAVKTDKDLASGSVLMDDLEGPNRQLVLSSFGSDVVGVEMEAVGAFSQVESRTGHLGVITHGIIKAFSDGSGGDVSLNKDERQRTATRNAAKVALAALQRLPD